MKNMRALIVLTILVGSSVVESSMHATPPTPRPAPAPHDAHGTPSGWKPTWPQGDARKGHEMYVKLECYRCHEIRGQVFPATDDKDKIGPELSMMGPAHEADYFVEALVNPSATIERGKGYEAADGSSKMPSYNDALSVQELIDLVAFLRGLRPPEAPAGHRH